MRSTRWRVAAAAAVAALCLVACAPNEEEPTPTSPSETAEPSYSDEELLEQARETYEGYLAAGAEMAESNDYDYTLLSEWAADPVATYDAARLEEIESSGVDIVGAPVVAAFVPSSAASDGLAISVDVCLDVTDQRYVDGDGIDVTPPDRPDQAALSLVFERSEVDRALILASQEPLADAATSPC